MAFRKRFNFPNLSVVNWFPGHMAKGMRNMGRRLQYCDCIIEVHDARPLSNEKSPQYVCYRVDVVDPHIPLSGRNRHFNSMLSGRPKILVLNKMDLADSTIEENILKELGHRGEEAIFTDCRAQRGGNIRKLMSKILEAVHWKASRSEDGVKLMVVGMPNVGKSSLINAIRRTYLKKGKATPVGKLPGVTRAVMTRIRVSEDPKMFLLDTPGIMMPNISSEEVAMKLAVIGMLQDHLIGETVIADYALFLLNQGQQFEYVTSYGLEDPCDNIEDTLDLVAQRLGAMLKGGVFDRTRAARHFLQRFRTGKLGRITLDSCLEVSRGCRDIELGTQPVQFLYTQ